jgi:hypothetical protein
LKKMAAWRSWMRLAALPALSFQDSAGKSLFPV